MRDGLVLGREPPAPTVPLPTHRGAPPGEADARLTLLEALRSTPPSRPERMPDHADAKAGRAPLKAPRPVLLWLTDAWWRVLARLVVSRQQQHTKASNAAAGLVRCMIFLETHTEL